MGASVLQGIPDTTLSPPISFTKKAFAEIARPDYIIRASSNENTYGPSRKAKKGVPFGTPFSLFKQAAIKTLFKTTRRLPYLTGRA